MKTTANLDLLYVILTGKVSLVFNRALQRNFRNHDLELSVDQFLVLSVLWQTDGLTQQELCEKTNKDKPSMTRIIDGLEGQSMLTRKVDNNDRRSNHIYLTTKGQELEAPVKIAVTEVVSQALNEIEADHLDVCKSVLSSVLLKIS